MRPTPRATTKVFDAARSSRCCCPFAAPESSSASEALSRSATEVRRRNCCISGECRASTSSARNSTTAWSSPPKSAARWFGASRVRNSAARRIPAGQPSVRCTSSSASPGSSRTPSWATSAEASLTLRARSADRISPSSPETRSRCSGQHRVGAGEQHDAQLGHRRPHQRRHRREHRRVVDQVEVVEHQHHRCGQLLQPGDEPAQHLRLAAETGHEPRQGVVGWHRPRAAQGADDVRPEGARLVVTGSSETQATGPTRGEPAAHAAVASVLPHPAPALTRVNGPRVPASSRASTWVRGTYPGGSRGRPSFVVDRPSSAAALDRASCAARASLAGFSWWSTPRLPGVGPRRDGGSVLRVTLPAAPEVALPLSGDARRRPSRHRGGVDPRRSRAGEGVRGARPR